MALYDAGGGRAKMARAIWKGAISFGMVAIPVRMYSATEERDLSFNLLHSKCAGRLKQVRYCSSCDDYIEWGDAVSGFAEEQDIDPVHFQRSYYLFGSTRQSNFSFVGHVGTGFSQASLREIFSLLHTNICPFVNPPSVERSIFWCEPALVCQVKYGEFTPDCKLRYPIFVGLRRDAAPSECVVENVPGWPDLNCIISRLGASVDRV